MASGRNLKNAVIAFLVPLPSIFFYLSFLNHYDSAKSPSFWSTLWSWCYHHPLLLANALFFLNVNVLFWAIGLIQSSHWVHTITKPPHFLFHFTHFHISFKVDIFWCLWWCRWSTPIGLWYLWCLFTTMPLILWLPMICGGPRSWFYWLGCGVLGSLITISGERGGSGVPGKIGVSLRWVNSMGSNGGGFHSLLSMSHNR